MVIAYGVSPCEKEGHTIRTRAGHCAQCNTARIAFSMRNDERAEIYVAQSKTLSMTKIGVAKSHRERMRTLNSHRYGGASDWAAHFHIEANNAGKAEHLAQRELDCYHLKKAYTRTGKIIDCQELFTCNISMAIRAVNNAIMQLTKKSTGPERRKKVLAKLKIEKITETSTTELSRKNEAPSVIFRSKHRIEDLPNQKNKNANLIGNKKFWYKNRAGIGNKITGEFISFSSTLREMHPVAGYTVKKKFPRNDESQSFLIKDNEIETPKTLDKLTIVSCPHCAHETKTPLTGHIKITCITCTKIWDQRL